MKNIDKEGVTERIYVLGRKDKKPEGVLNIGRYYALDSSLGSNVYVDILRPHVMTICGKRGYGKSYTIGVLIEEIARLEKKIKDNLGVIIIDTLGIYWTTIKTNQEKNILKKWNLKPESFDINLLVPNKHIKTYKENNIEAKSFSIPASELTPFHWCQLFNIKPTDPLGIALTRAVLKLKEQKPAYSLQDLTDYIKNDRRCDETVKAAAENFLKTAELWSIFDKNGISVQRLIERGAITVLDISHLPTEELKDIVVSVVGEKIFEERVKARKIHEQKKMGITVKDEEMPMVWMAIDEAHIFLPHDKKNLSKKVLINEWMRQGRQPGLSLILATQRPSSVDSEVLSHSDLIICHRLTSHEDIESLGRIRPTYMHSSIEEAIRKIGDEKGVALIVDDTSESSHIIKIRPRLSWHGGAESLVFKP
ncbi:MAG: ATP-binding protein [Candidatus Thermoplasmatota archaeon]